LRLTTFFFLPEPEASNPVEPMLSRGDVSAAMLPRTAELERLKLWGFCGSVSDGLYGESDCARAGVGTSHTEAIAVNASALRNLQRRGRGGLHRTIAPRQRSTTARRTADGERQPAFGRLGAAGG